MTGLGTAWISVPALLFVVGAFATLLLSTCCALFRPWIVARRARSSIVEPVSVVIPVKNFDHGFLAAQASVLTQTISDFEVIVSARDLESRAAREARTLFSGAIVPVRFVRSTRVGSASPKIDNLVEAVDAARNDVVFMKDSNVELPPDACQAALRAMADDVGIVCAHPNAAGALNFAAFVEAQIMNQSHGRLLLMADVLGFGYGIGKVMVFRRSALARIGGLEASAHSVGEDNLLARSFDAIGLRTVFMEPPVRQQLGTRSWHDLWHRQMRWTAIRASNEKVIFALELFSFSVVAAAAAALAAPLVGLSAPVAALGCLAAWFAVETLLAVAKGWQVSMTGPAAMIARDMVLLAVWAAAWFSREVTWAGETVPVRQERRDGPAACRREGTQV